MAASPWAGSEELWVAAADAALDCGHTVTASVFRWPNCIPPKLAALASREAIIVWRKRYGVPSIEELAIKAANLVTAKPLASAMFLPAALGAMGRKGAFRQLLARKPEVICISQGWPYDLLDAPGSRTLLRQVRRSGIPYIIICQLNLEVGHPSKIVRDEVAQLYASARAVLFVSERNRRATERQLAIRLSDARIVRNPVNMTDHTILPCCVSTKADAVTFACVARLDAAQKGQDLLFETLRSPAWQDRAWHLNVYGTGDDDSYLRKLVDLNGLADRVDFLGHAADVRQVWIENDALLLASRGEGMSLATIEAMLCGKVVIVTDVGGNTEWIEDEWSGFIAPAATVSSLSSALERAWSARDYWQEIGRRAHEAALSRLDPAPGQTVLRLIEKAERAAIRA